MKNRFEKHPGQILSPRNAWWEYRSRLKHNIPKETLILLEYAFIAGCSWSFARYDKFGEKVRNQLNEYLTKITD